MPWGVTGLGMMLPKLRPLIVMETEKGSIEEVIVFFISSICTEYSVTPCSFPNHFTLISAKARQPKCPVDRVGGSGRGAFVYIVAQCPERDSFRFLYSSLYFYSSKVVDFNESATRFTCWLTHARIGGYSGGCCTVNNAYFLTIY